MTVDIDDSGSPVTVDLSSLKSPSTKTTGVQLADLIQDQLNRKFGDERYFDLSNANDGKFGLSFTLSGTTTNVDINLASITGQSDVTTLSQVKIEDIKEEITAKVAAASYGSGTGVPITVDYDYSSRTFTFKPTSDASATISIVGGTVGSPVANGLFGLGITPTAVNVSNGTYGASNGGLNTAVVPNGDLIRPAAQQRYGITVSYDGAQETFSISSGTTGDASEIEIDFTVGGATQSEFAKFMGFEATNANDSKFTVNAKTRLSGVSLRYLL